MLLSTHLLACGKTKTFVISGSDCRLMKRRKHFMQTSKKKFASFDRYITSFWDNGQNTFLADQDNKQPCFSVDYKQLLADIVKFIHVGKKVPS